jgi:uncharacterized membrane protein
MKSYVFKFKKYLLQALGVFLGAFLLNLSGYLNQDFSFTKQIIISAVTSALLYAISVLRAWIKNNLTNIFDFKE